MTSSALRLTQSSVSALPLVQPGDAKRQRLYFDTDLKGFGLLVGAKAKTFFVQRDVNGKTVRTTVGRYGVLTVKQATEEARALLFQMTKGINPNQERRKPGAVTYGDALETHLTSNRGLAPRTASDYRYLSEQYLSDWLKRPLSEITRADCRDRHKKIGTENGPYVANHTFRVFSAVYNTALKVHEDLGVNPVIAVDRYKEKRRKAAIPSAQLSTWYGYINDLQDPIRRDWHLFVLFSGLRRSDAEAVRWEPDPAFPRAPIVDFANKAILVPLPKSQEPFYLPLSDFLLALLKRRRDCEHAKALYPASGWVFPANSKKKHGHIAEPEKPKKNKEGETVKVLPVPFTVHGLRNTFITVAESLDLSPYAIKMLVNHSLPDKQDVTAGYISAEVERLRKPMQQVTDKLLSLCGEKPTGKRHAPAKKAA
ncbi:hypothetical protein B1992_10435 [Pseudoxanthomonas broegbernensis]|uniref:Integrase DNA-binding domain-containing protein n=1 Tax=Pseudoxanthomonas broegbernensis TaxID=83619 RepID=A0A7V8K6P8_9GAMM|nr:integrase family protein [Pseudoxanthomonas broegbernensis]KAF1685882.1 hypothetical protein B1992_10435 [Pseudoxanthomonas broegbernensis]MBB6064103.1 integrase [Pseudoxanthomonas broegbernensis]